jgi:hypothetical protein
MLSHDGHSDHGDAGILRIRILGVWMCENEWLTTASTPLSLTSLGVDWPSGTVRRRYSAVVSVRAERSPIKLR